MQNFIRKPRQPILQKLFKYNLGNYGIRILAGFGWLKLAISSGFSYSSLESQGSVIRVPASLKTATKATANKIGRFALQGTVHNISNCVLRS
jgi:hypothetical protein